jgi:hypothetical protein
LVVVVVSLVVGVIVDIVVDDEVGGGVVVVGGSRGVVVGAVAVVGTGGLAPGTTRVGGTVVVVDVVEVDVVAASSEGVVSCSERTDSGHCGVATVVSAPSVPTARSRRSPSRRTVPDVFAPAPQSTSVTVSDATRTATGPVTGLAKRTIPPGAVTVTAVSPVS